MKQGPRRASTTQSISTQYFGFLHHTFITNDVIEHKKRCYSIFNGERQALVFTPLNGWIFITRLITAQPKCHSSNVKLSLSDNRLIVFVNFSFSSGCDLHDRSQNC